MPKRLIYLFITIFIISIVPKISCGFSNVKHPVYPLTLPVEQFGFLNCRIKTTEVLVQKVKTIMDIPNDTLDAWNPPYADFFNIGCPHCKAAVSNWYASMYMTWDPKEPEKLICKNCGHEFPSKKYPLDNIKKIKTPSGTIRSYPYYQGKDGKAYYMESNLYYLRRLWLRDQACYLAIAYALTKNPKYANKVGIIIKRFAENYPEMAIHGRNKKGMPVFYDDVRILAQPKDGVQPMYTDKVGLNAYYNYEQPYPYYGVRASSGSHHYSEIDTQLLLAYDQVAEALDLKTRNVIEGYFRAQANYVRTYPRYLTNMDPVVINSVIICGRVIGEPEFVHGGINHLKMFLKSQFFPDGMWKEGSPGYGLHVYEHLYDALEHLKGYRDPDGYIGKEQNVHYDLSFIEDFEKKVTNIERALRKFQLPDGTLAAVYDTHPSMLVKAEDQPLMESKPDLLWSTGHGTLGMGSGDNQIQARIQFMGHVGHYHYDILGLQLFNKGREIESEVGYTLTKLRPYSSSTFAHNLIMVDESNQVRARARDDNPSMGGKLIYYGVQVPEVQFISVNSETAYPHLKKYRRSLALIKVSEKKRYLVDLFEVSGGSQYDWLLHGDADRNGSVVLENIGNRSGAKLDFRTDRCGGGKLQTSFDDISTKDLRDYLKSNPLGLVRNMKTACTDEQWAATFKSVPDDGTALRVTMIGKSETEIISGDIPSIRRCRTMIEGRNRERTDKAMNFWMPIVIARRKGKSLDSTFLAVHEPYADEPFIKSIYREGKALIVETENCKDVHLFYGNNGNYKMKGKYGFLRLRKDSVIKAYLADGTLLDYKNCTIQLAPENNGEIIDKRGNIITLSGECSLDNGDRIYLEFPSGEVYSVKIVKVNTQKPVTEVILKHDPGFEINKDGTAGRFTSFPNTHFTGPVTYRVPRWGAYQAN